MKRCAVAWLARSIGAAQSAISAWCRGTGRPDCHMRAVVEVLFGIPPNLWLTSDERDVVARAVVLARAGRGCGPFASASPSTPPPSHSSHHKGS